MPKDKKFYLRAGVLLHYAGGMYVNENLTDDIAMDAINDNRGRLDLFQKTPDNLEELLAARKAVKAEEKAEVDNAPKDELLKQIEGLKAVNAEQAEKLEGAQKTFEEQEKEKETLLIELNTVKEQLEKSKAEAQAEIDRLNGVIAEKDAKIEELEKALAAATTAAPAAASDVKDAPEAPAEGAAAEAPKTKAAAAKK